MVTWLPTPVGCGESFGCRIFVFSIFSLDYRPSAEKISGTSALKKNGINAQSRVIKKTDIFSIFRFTILIFTFRRWMHLSAPHNMAVKSPWNKRIFRSDEKLVAASSENDTFLSLILFFANKRVAPLQVNISVKHPSDFMRLNCLSANSHWFGTSPTIVYGADLWSSCQSTNRLLSLSQ